MSEQHKAAARAVFEVWTSGELHRLDELVACDVVHHDPYKPQVGEGLAGMKRTIELHRTAFPELHLVVDDQVAESDKVATRWHGELATTSGTRGRLTLFGVTIDRFEDGKIVEAWRSMDVLGFRLALALLAATPSPQE